MFVAEAFLDRHAGDDRLLLDEHPAILFVLPHKAAYRL